jgi:hypothetical protein
MHGILNISCFYYFLGQIKACKLADQNLGVGKQKKGSYVVKVLPLFIILSIVLPLFYLSST